jgi:superfamily II DNA or RNA helicase
MFSCNLIMPRLNIMANFQSLIKTTSCWNDIYNGFKKHNVEKDRLAGKLFEQFCKYYYLADPSVKNEYKEVWLFHEIPYEIKQKLNLGNVDHGIDLVLQGNDGTFSVVQCKFRNNQNSIISWTKDSLANLFADGDKADYFVVFTNASGIDKHSLTKKYHQLKIVTLGDLLNISASTFREIRSYAIGIAKPPACIKKPRDYQQKAIQAVINGFKQSDRGQLILPCGAGKTLVSLWIKDALNIKHTLVLVPSLALLRQVKSEWSINSPNFIPYICVCSEKDIDDGKDLAKVYTYEIGGRVSTDPSEIRDFLSSNKKSIVYSTYQSLDVICKAAKKIGFKFDLAICDEAHKTSGAKLGSFGLIHSDSNIRVQKRLYMTATPRVISESLKNKSNEENISYLCDMNDPKIFGSEFHKMTFKEAIDKKILVDYKIVAVGVSEQELEKAIKLRRYISDTVTIDEIANNYALEKFMEESHPTHAITFHSSVRKAQSFQARHREIYPDVPTYHVNGVLTTNERNLLMKEFEASPKSVMTNARCLTEGIDMPAIDVVYFCDPKNSVIDIVQAAGRALRRDDNKGKKLGYVVVPIFHHEQETVDEVIDAGPFKNLMSVIRSLCSQDERLLDEIKTIKLGKGERSASSDHISVNSSCELITLVGFNEKLKSSLFYQVISKSHTPFRSFKEAREFVHSLELKSGAYWRKYCKSGNKPQDIPGDPRKVYKNEGWKSMGDWLGTGTVAPSDMIFRPFEEARKFVRLLGLKDGAGWTKYCRSGNKPADISTHPRRTYKNKGWKSMGDWLGTGTVATYNMVYRPFEEARKFTRSLKLKSGDAWKNYCKNSCKPSDIPSDPRNVYKNKGWKSMGDWLGLKSRADWEKYCKSGNKPSDIPANPSRVYKDEIWKSWGDWLGTGTVATQNIVYRSFEKARKFVHSLGLKNDSDWRKYCKSGNKPSDIPANPSRVYKDEGWKSLGDWLGTGTIATYNIVYRPFEEARKFVRSLGLKNDNDWRKYYKSGMKPSDIPSDPGQVYEDEGWKSLGDWLGTGNVASQDMVYRPFEEAREFVRSLGLKRGTDWDKYCKSGEKPIDVPIVPEHVYKNEGWKSMGDWLGTGKISNQDMIFRSFQEARELVCSLRLKNLDDWRKYCNSGQRPSDIPADPSKVYKNKGWISLGDWLGTGTIAARDVVYRPFKKAREFVHSLGLKNDDAWRMYCKRGDKPEDIPSNPNNTYKNKGWKSIGDWLGTDKNKK